MQLLATMITASALVELLLYLPGFWRARKSLAIGALALTAFAGGLLFAQDFAVGGVLLCLLGLYRIANQSRIIKGRMHEQFLRRAALRSSLTFIGLHALVTLSWLAWDAWAVTGHVFWVVVAGMQLLAAAISLLSVLRSVRTTAWPGRVGHYSDDELPSVSVAIAARNETDDLNDLLVDVLASDYPKLEVLVFDDASQVKRTPEIIRSFAHAGVRFLKGDEPSAQWLPKNQAYDRLATESSGEYILFCGADMRFKPDSLRQLISTILDRKKQMLSVVPQRATHVYGRASLIQPMRYWWELVPPRRLFNRPPVLSSCWIIRRKSLEDAGGFDAVKRSIVPEAYFARRTATGHDGYSFLRAGMRQGVTSVKTIAQQRATALRIRYPQVHRCPEQVAVHAFLELIFLFLPFVLAVGGFWLPIGLAAQILAVLASGCLIATHLIVTQSTRVNTLWFGLIAPPFMIVADVALLHYSMLKYEFGQVIWKGRNIVGSAMQSKTAAS